MRRGSARGEFEVVAGDAEEEACGAAGVGAARFAEGGGLGGVAAGGGVFCRGVALEDGADDIDSAWELERGKEARAERGGGGEVGEFFLDVGAGDPAGEGIDGDGEVGGDFVDGEGGIAEVVDGGGGEGRSGVEVHGGGHVRMMYGLSGEVNRLLFGTRGQSYKYLS